MRIRGSYNMQGARRIRITQRKLANSSASSSQKSNLELKKIQTKTKNYLKYDLLQTQGRRPERSKETAPCPDRKLSI